MPRHKPLTDREVALVAYLRTHMAERGYAPTMQEIGDRFGWSSLATVHEHLSRLEAKGVIRREGHARRGILVLDPPGRS